MSTVIRVSITLGVIWFLLYFLALIGGFVLHPDPGNERATAEFAQTQLFNIGAGVAGFLRAPLQIALIIYIIIEAGKRLGIFSDGNQSPGGRKFAFDERLLNNTSVQGSIALLIVGAVVIGALGYGQVDTLKDLALVVVGFYFGTKKAEIDKEDDRNRSAGGAAVEGAVDRTARDSTPGPSEAPDHTETPSPESSSR